MCFFFVEILIMIALDAQDLFCFSFQPMGKTGGGGAGGMFGGFSQTTAKVLEKDIGVKFG